MGVLQMPAGKAFWSASSTAARDLKAQPGLFDGHTNDQSGLKVPIRCFRVAHSRAAVTLGCAECVDSTFPCRAGKLTQGFTGARINLR